MPRTAKPKSPKSLSPNNVPVERRAILPLDCLIPSPTNPRKRFDQESLRELAASIEANGLLQPLVVRLAPGFSVVPGKANGTAGFIWENPKWKLFGPFAEKESDCLRQPPYEIVCGERRFRALRLIKGRFSASVSILELTDKQVLEIQAVENEQRQDVTPSEKFAHYVRMLKAGATYESIAAAIGKSVSTIREVMKMGRCPEVLLKAVDAGDVPPSVAALVGRVPGDFARERVAHCVMAGKRWWSEKTFHDPKEKHPQPMEDSVPLSYRETEEIIEQHCKVELKQARFDRKALNLVSGVGSCDDCPKRAGNDPDLVAAGVRADVCTDPGCFRRKCEAHAALELAGLVDGGAKTLSRALKEKHFFDTGHLMYGAPFVDLDDSCGLDPAAVKRKYSKLLEGLPPSKVLVARFDNGVIKRVVRWEDAKAHLKQKHGIDAGGRQHGGSATSNHQREERKKAEAGKAAGRLAGAKVAEQAEALWNGGGSMTPWLRQLALQFCEGSWSDCCRQVAKRRGQPIQNSQPSEAVRLVINQMESDAELFGVVAELISSRLALHWGHPYFSGKMSGAEQDFWRVWGVERGKLLQEAGEAKKAAKKPSRNGKAMAGAARSV